MPYLWVWPHTSFSALHEDIGFGAFAIKTVTRQPLVQVCTDWGTDWGTERTSEVPGVQLARLRDDENAREGRTERGWPLALRAARGRVRRAWPYAAVPLRPGRKCPTKTLFCRWWHFAAVTRTLWGLAADVRLSLGQVIHWTGWRPQARGRHSLGRFTDRGSNSFTCSFNFSKFAPSGRPATAGGRPPVPGRSGSGWPLYVLETAVGTPRHGVRPRRANTTGARGPHSVPAPRPRHTRQDVWKNDRRAAALRDLWCLILRHRDGSLRRSTLARRGQKSLTARGPAVGETQVATQTRRPAPRPVTATQGRAGTTVFFPDLLSGGRQGAALLKDILKIASAIFSPGC